MDAKLHIVQHLYGEGGDPSDLQRLLEDEAVRKDYEALSETKRYLDQRQPVRPDPPVIDRIVAAAATPKAGVLPGKRQDRTARPGRTAQRYRLIGALSGVLALVLVVGIGLNQFVFQDGTMRAPAPEVSASRQEAPAEAEAVASEAVPKEAEEAGVDARMTAGVAREAEDYADAVGALAPQPPSASEDRVATVQPFAADADELAVLEKEAATPAPVALEPAAAALDDVTLAGARAARRDAGPTEETAPTWNESDELLRVHRSIDMLRARSRALIWDESAVMSLDSLPAQPTEALPGLNAAGKKQEPRQQP